MLSSVIRLLSSTFRSNKLSLVTFVATNNTIVLTSDKESLEAQQKYDINVTSKPAIYCRVFRFR
jgi:hypothetical protein